jgi:hypothetical protein
VSRVDDQGRAYAGSQLQIQIYVNRRSHELFECVLDVLPSLASLSPRLRWVSPLESQGFVEYQDREFLRAVGLDRLWRPLSGFWPRRGPVWDALAVAEIGPDPDGWGVVLVEGKSHRAELRGKGCGARPRSRARIEARLRETKCWLGVPQRFDWTGELYQYANRLAHLYFFRRVVGIPAWLVNVYFLADPHCPAPYPPMSRVQWRTALAEAKAELGLAGVAIPYAGDLFLEGKDRRELTG